MMILVHYTKSFLQIFTHAHASTTTYESEQGHILSFIKNA